MKVLTNAFRPIHILPPREAYRIWADTYDDNANNAVIQLEEKIILPMLDAAAISGKKAIDLGCGTGRHVHHLLTRGAKQVVGIDLSGEMLSIAQSHVDAERTTLMQARITCLPLAGNQFDVAVASLVLSHEKDLEAAFREIRRVLRSGATLMITDLHWSFETRGWKRTFAGKVKRGKRLAVENVVHLPSEYEGVIQKTCFAVEKYLEPAIDQALVSVFERTQMLETYRRYFGEPLLIAYQLRAT